MLRDKWVDSYLLFHTLNLNSIFSEITTILDQQGDRQHYAFRHPCIDAQYCLAAETEQDRTVDPVNLFGKNGKLQELQRKSRDI